VGDAGRANGAEQCAAASGARTRDWARQSGGRREQHGAHEKSRLARVSGAASSE